MIKIRDLLKVVIIFLITAILIISSSVLIYKVNAQPKFYDHFMSLGNKYLESGNYQEAVLSFNKAIDIQRKSTDARVGLAKGSVELNDIDTAVNALNEAMDIDQDNEKLLLDSIEILRDVAPDAAYDLLIKYVDGQGEGKLSPEVKELVDSSNEKPQKPEVTPSSGTYIKAFSMRLTSSKTRVGHSYHYTLDGSDVTKESSLYRGGVKIEKNTAVKIVGFNRNGENTDVCTVEYKFDFSMEGKLSAEIKNAKTLHDKTQEGTQIGNCTVGSKATFSAVIKEAEKLMSNEYITLQSASLMIISLQEATAEFNNSIIVPCDKSKLNAAIVKAEKLLNGATEGYKDGQVKPGSKNTLKAVIDKANKLNQSVSTKQEQADNMTAELNKAITTFENSRVRVVVNPDGSNFTYGFKTLMGNETHKSYKGRFTVIKSGLADVYPSDEYVYKGETGDITIELTRNGNSVTVFAKEEWDNGYKSFSTRGTWYAEYNGATEYFKLYPDSAYSEDRYEGTFSNGKMTGKGYVSGIGHYINFTATS